MNEIERLFIRIRDYLCDIDEMVRGKNLGPSKKPSLICMGMSSLLQSLFTLISDEMSNSYHTSPEASQTLT